MTTALNCEEPEKAVGIFKPFARRLNPEPFVESDADEELMIVAHFGDSPVHIHKLMVIGGGGEGQTGHDTHPNKLLCYVNRTDLDFSSIDEYPVSQDFDLHVNANGKPYCRIVPSLEPQSSATSLRFALLPALIPSNLILTLIPWISYHDITGTAELITSIREFTNVYSVAFFFPSNFGGGDKTQVRYIGMQGEHTHYRREAVHADYEVMCNGQDIEHHDDGHKPGVAPGHGV